METNYFPLWEAERGRFHMTHPVKRPRPIGEFTRLMGRHYHLEGESLSRLQHSVNERFALIQSLCGLGR